VGTLVCVVASEVVGVLGVSARLRWWAARERRQLETVRALPDAVVGGGEVNVEDVREDGSRLRVRLVATKNPPREC
jgi:hypothetical protein